MSHLTLNDAIQQLREAGLAALDRISSLTGYAAMRVPLQSAGRPGEVTLDLTGYRQVDSYSCGAVAMVVKFFHPRMCFERIHGVVAPDEDIGVGTLRLSRALRSLGVEVTCRRKLTFAGLCAAIDAGRPVLACVTTRAADTDHWVVIYGYGRRPNLVFVAGQGLPFIGRQRVQWPDFRKQWSPAGTGWVCGKAPRPK